MKSVLSFTICAVLAVVLTVGCKSTAPPQVIRISSNADGQKWNYSLNGIVPFSTGSTADVTNWVAKLHLKFGDIVLFGDLPKHSAITDDLLTPWLNGYFDSNRVAIYIYPSGQNVNFFSIPTFHWLVPFSNPRDLKGASFYFEGKPLGSGISGYDRMLTKIREVRCPRVFILSSLYDITRGFGPLEEPFEAQESALRNALTDSKTERVYPSQLPGF